MNSPPKSSKPTLRILGTRGIPAAHGGFETFAERLAVYLVAQGWRVVVYCQHEGPDSTTVDDWNGVERVRIAVHGDGAASTIVFDWKATLHAAKYPDLCMTLGYNTAVFCLLLRIRGRRNVINMDGVEWSRAKWGKVAKAWFWANDWLGCWLGDHLVADNPGIAKHLGSRVSTRKISMIPYGADEVLSAEEEPVRMLGLVPGEYLTLIARPEPENSVLEIVTGFTAAAGKVKLAVLGQYRADNAYHRAVKAAANDRVVFTGAIYDQPTLRALRFHSLAYLHGHTVGGTNPSLVEALGAGNAVIAHDNQFNRWVAGDGARYFSDSTSLKLVLDELLGDEAEIWALRQRSRARFTAGLTWPTVLRQYEALLLSVAT